MTLTSGAFLLLRKTAERKAKTAKKVAAGKQLQANFAGKVIDLSGICCIIEPYEAPLFCGGPE